MKTSYQSDMSGFSGNPSEYAAHETFTLFEDVLTKRLSIRIRATGRSMSPFLLGGEMLMIKKVACDSLRRGDLILFRDRQGFPVLHRIVKKSLIDNILVFLTKGDALIAFDESVCENEVLGKVCGIEKNDSNGKAKYIDMESYLWRRINYMIALVNLIKSRMYFVFFRFCKVKNVILH